MQKLSNKNVMKISYYIQTPRNWPWRPRPKPRTTGRLRGASWPRPRPQGLQVWLWQI